MNYLTFDQWKEQYYHIGNVVKCGSNCTWCEISAGPGWREFDNCTLRGISLGTEYYRCGESICKTCSDFIPKNDWQLRDMYDEYVRDFKNNDPEYKFMQEEKEFNKFVLMQDLGIVSDADPEQYNEGFSEDYDGEIDV